MTPQMHVDQMFFNAASNLTGGIVSDVTTAMISLIGVLFIMLGYSKLAESISLAGGVADGGGTSDGEHSTRNNSGRGSEADYMTQARENLRKSKEFEFGTKKDDLVSEMFKIRSKEYTRKAAIAGMK